jgi:hypothetical protein
MLGRGRSGYGGDAARLAGRRARVAVERGGRVVSVKDPSATNRARIHFAANDDRGNWTGLAQAIEIEFADTDEQIKVALDVRVAWFKRTIRIGGRKGITVPCRGHESWVGNMAWEATVIHADDALAIVRWLLDHNGCVEMYTSDGVIGQLVEESHAG